MYVWIAVLVGFVVVLLISLMAISKSRQTCLDSMEMGDPLMGGVTLTVVGYAEAEVDGKTIGVVRFRNGRLGYEFDYRDVDGLFSGVATSSRVSRYVANVEGNAIDISKVRRGTLLKVANILQMCGSGSDEMYTSAKEFVSIVQGVPVMVTRVVYSGHVLWKRDYESELKDFERIRRLLYRDLGLK